MAEQLCGEIAELKQVSTDVRINFNLQLTGCRNVKVVRAVLTDHGNDVDKVKAEDLWLYPLEYCYFVKGTLEWSLRRLLFRDGDHGERFARERLLKYILVFESEDERSGFGDLPKRNKDKCEGRVSRQGEPSALASGERRAATGVRV